MQEYKISPEVAGMLIRRCNWAMAKSILKAILLINFDSEGGNLRVSIDGDRVARILIRPGDTETQIDASSLCEFVAAIPDWPICKRSAFTEVCVETVWKTSDTKPGWGRTP